MEEAESHSRKDRVGWWRVTPNAFAASRRNFHHYARTRASLHNFGRCRSVAGEAVAGRREIITKETSGFLFFTVYTSPLRYYTRVVFSRTHGRRERGGGSCRVRRGGET